MQSFRPLASKRRKSNKSKKEAPIDFYDVFKLGSTDLFEFRDKSPNFKRQTSFYNKLCTLNKRITAYKETFMDKIPRFLLKKKIKSQVNLGPIRKSKFLLRKGTLIRPRASFRCITNEDSPDNKKIE